MNTSDNLKYLYSLNRLGIKTSLVNIRKLCSLLNEPQNSYPVIHIAGTNGKGTTASMLCNIFKTAGLKCGLYTSPHLVKFGERIRIGDEILSDEEASYLVEELKSHFEETEATFFEAATAMAFLHFARKGVDAAVIETGLGGSWDATNIVQPRMCIFTPISLDHTERLGKEIAQIAADKAGIIKAGAVVVSSEQTESGLVPLKDKTAQCSCKFYYTPEVFKIFDGKCTYSSSILDIKSQAYPKFEGKYNIALPGKHQWTNLLTVLTAASQLPEIGFDISEEVVKTGAETTRWKGRLEILRETPLIYYDVGHNPAAAKAVAEFFRELFFEKKIRILLGIPADKDIHQVLLNLAPITSDFTFTTIPSERSADPEVMAEYAKKMGVPARVISNPEEAVSAIWKEISFNETALITGSHYLGEAVYENRLIN